MKLLAGLRAHFWFVTAELTVAICKTFQTNGELYITASNYVLNFEFGELRIEPQFLYYSGVLPRRKP